MREYIVPVGDKGNMNMIENELHLQQLIRCKDCNHFEPDGIYTICYRHNGLSPNDDWYCADGERKEG